MFLCLLNSVLISFFQLSPKRSEERELKFSIFTCMWIFKLILIFEEFQILNEYRTVFPSFWTPCSLSSSSSSLQILHCFHLNFQINNVTNTKWNYQLNFDLLNNIGIEFRRPRNMQLGTEFWIYFSPLPPLWITLRK